jgi:hypothetical protein
LALNAIGVVGAIAWAIVLTACISWSTIPNGLRRPGAPVSARLGVNINAWARSPIRADLEFDSASIFRQKHVEQRELVRVHQLSVQQEVEARRCVEEVLPTALLGVVERRCASAGTRPPWPVMVGDGTHRTAGNIEK